MSVKEYEIVLLTDGRSGYFYRARFTENLIFQPTDEVGHPVGDPELADEEHEVNNG